MVLLRNRRRADFELPTGVQTPFQAFRGGFLVTDGHLNRMLRVALDGDISVVRAVDNIVPVGLETWGKRIYMAQAGPLPHLPADGKIVSFTPTSSRPPFSSSLREAVVETRRPRMWSTSALESTHQKGPGVMGAEVFDELVGRHRRELLAHCYRMLGSIDEAEDAVQEAFLRAWRAYSGFEGRASERTWLYRIATNVCLTAIEKRGKRPLPSGLGAPADDAEAQLELGAEVPWLQPFPDALLATHLSDPAAVTSSRASIRLAFVAALQHLSARQRAILILRDVLGMPAAEVAELLETTTTAVNSGLRRAREQLAQSEIASDDIAEPIDSGTQAVLDRFAAAVEAGDASAMAELLREDVVLEMPPFLTWFAGREVVSEFVERFLLGGPGDLRLVATGANTQPAFAVYRRVDNEFVLHALQVLDLDDSGISHITAFSSPDEFGAFDLPAALAG